MQVSTTQAERLRDQLHATQRAYMLSMLDHHRGREGPGMGLAATVSGGNLPVIVGRGHVGYALFQHHLNGAGLPVIGGALPVMGAGFGSWIKKVGSLGKKAVQKATKLAGELAAEHGERLTEIARGGLTHAMNSTGSIGDRLRGGIAKAATEGHAYARDEAARRIQSLIA